MTLEECRNMKERLERENEQLRKRCAKLATNKNVKESRSITKEVAELSEQLESASTTEREQLRQRGEALCIRFQRLEKSRCLRSYRALTNKIIENVSKMESLHPDNKSDLQSPSMKEQTSDIGSKVKCKRYKLASGKGSMHFYPKK